MYIYYFEKFWQRATFQSAANERTFLKSQHATQFTMPNEYKADINIYLYFYVYVCVYEKC